MTSKIDRDKTRFREIVKGKIRQNLRHYVSHGEMIGRKGKDLVSIPSLNWTYRGFGTGITAAAVSGEETVRLENPLVAGSKILMARGMPVRTLGVISLR